MAHYATIGDTLEQTVARYPDADAIVSPRKEQRWTYREFDDRVNRLANSLLELGVEKGDRVATVLHNGSEMTLSVYACAKIGAVFTPLNFRLPADEIEYIVNDAEATTISRPTIWRRTSSRATPSPSSSGRGSTTSSTSYRRTRSAGFRSSNYARETPGSTRTSRRSERGGGSGSSRCPADRRFGCRRLDRRPDRYRSLDCVRRFLRWLHPARRRPFHLP